MAHRLPKSRRSRLLITSTVGVTRLLAVLAVGSSSAAPSHARAAKAQIIVGLITKTDTNPFFVKMKQGAQNSAKQLTAKLLTAAGKFDGDNASQVTAIENMVTAGAKGILITPSDTKAIVPAIKKARDAGVVGSDRFGHYVAEIWHDLREEATRGIEDSEAQARGRGSTR